MDFSFHSSNRHPILGFNFVFWIIVYIVADSTFKRFRTTEEILAVRSPEERELYVFE